MQFSLTLFTFPPPNHHANASTLKKCIQYPPDVHFNYPKIFFLFIFIEINYTQRFSGGCNEVRITSCISFIAFCDQSTLGGFLIR
jgi:hypothetical protein